MINGIAHGWRRLDGRRIQIPIKKAVEDTIIRETQAGHRLKVCIGTDSQIRGSSVEFATVIVFLREKKGGFMFIRNSAEKQKVGLRERMILEVAKSVETAYALCDLLDRYDVALEVHADINTDPHFKSNEALKEAMGYILGMGFVFKAKPDAFASSSCADKVV
ncbi:MAG: ribonuclease H-like YkuK family protein [Saprospiraceae bacterium]|nr:ribonuclease H-like YkuK family protein [Saprospiraceae bacterium]